VSPAHYAAAAAEPNFEVLQAMTMMNLKIFHQKDKWCSATALCCALRRAWRLCSTSYSRTHPRRALAKPSAGPTSYTSLPFIDRASHDAEHCLCIPVPPGSGSAALTSQTADATFIHTAVFPEVNGMPAIIREILRRRPDAASAITLLMLSSIASALLACVWRNVLAAGP
jgi:hypothetical protein